MGFDAARRPSPAACAVSVHPSQVPKFKRDMELQAASSKRHTAFLVLGWQPSPDVAETLLGERASAAGGIITLLQDLVRECMPRAHTLRCLRCPCPSTCMRFCS
ncbi:hypothetical protein EON66_04445 [archaeon]|nr:MAG: hypothetical protein EON66_04445 [archaeon]